MPRRRYRFDEATQQLVEIDPEANGPTRPPVFGDMHYDGLRAPDGTDISSRTKFKAYTKATGYALTSDYANAWAKADAERHASPRPDAARRDAIGRATYELEKRARR